MTQSIDLLLQREASWIIGLALGGMTYGALLTLGIICLRTFHKVHRAKPHSGGTDRTVQNRILQTHVVLLLVLNTCSQAWNIRIFIKGLVYTDRSNLTFFYRDRSSIFLVLIVVLCDGLLVSY
jgi:hypothetical protein